MNIRKKYADLSNPSKAAIWFTICNIILKGISFLTVPLFTRILTDSEYGKLTIYLSYEQVFFILATWEIHLGAYQKGIFKFKKEIDVFTSNTLLTVNILSIIFFSIVLIFKEAIRKVLGINIRILFIMFSFFILQPAYYCWLARKRTNYEYKSAVIITLGYSIISVVFGLFGIIIYGKTADVKYISSTLGMMIICMYFYLSSSHYFKYKGENAYEHCKYLISFEGPLVFHSLSYLVLSQADRVMIGKYVGNSQAAYYSVAYSIASVISIFQNSINQTLLPWRYERLEAGEYKDIKKVTNILLIFISFATIFFIIIAPEIINVMFTSNYQEAKWCIPAVASSVYFIFLYTIFVSIETYYEKTQYVMYVSVTCGIINVILNYFGIKIFGYIACAYTTLISYILFAVGHYFFMKKTVKDKVDIDKIADRKTILLISSVLIAFTVVSNLVYNSSTIKYTAILAITCLGIMNRKKVTYLVDLIRNQ